MNELLSATDLARRYGYTRGLWNNLMTLGKLKYQQTSAGKITTEAWVQEYLSTTGGHVDLQDGE